MIAQPAFDPALRGFQKDPDKVRARSRANHEVESGKRPHPNALPCTDCGHIWREGETRHEYDHYLGYAPEHYSDVQSVCAPCHKQRDCKRVKQTHCVHGHEFTPENTGRKKSNGTRYCRQCNRDYDKRRRDAAFWRSYRAKRRAK